MTRQCLLTMTIYIHTNMHQHAVQILVGFYSTGHSHLGSPGVAYVRALPQLALTAHPSVVGVMSFTMLAPCGPRLSVGDGSCRGDGGYPSWLIQLCAKGCAIADAYAELVA